MPDDKGTPPVKSIADGSEEKTSKCMGKNVLIAMTTVVVVALVMGGFLVGVALMNQMTKQVSDNLVKIFQFQFKVKGEEVQETIKTDIKSNTTEMNTKNKKGDQNTFFNDFKKGLTVIASRPAEGDGACYVLPMNRTSSVDPATLERYIKTHPIKNYTDVQSDPDEQTVLVPAEEPIRDTHFLGQRISDLCSGLSMYWLYPEQIHRNHADEEVTTSIPYGPGAHRRSKRWLPYVCLRHRECNRHYMRHSVWYRAHGICNWVCCSRILKPCVWRRSCSNCRWEYKCLTILYRPCCHLWDYCPS